MRLITSFALLLLGGVSVPLAGQSVGDRLTYLALSSTPVAGLPPLATSTILADVQSALKAYSGVAQSNFNYRDVQARIKRLRANPAPAPPSA